MPLIKRGNKKALEHNIKAEINAHPDKRKQDLAIAFSVQRKAKAKKMADGGEISAANEKRSMPNDLYDDQKQAKMDNQKPIKDGQWVDAPQDRQAQRGPKFEKLKHPKMVAQNAYSVKMRGYEDDLVEHAKPTSPDEELPQRLAKGGEINEDVSMHDAEMDNQQDPEGLESDNDEMSPEMAEYMSKRMPAFAKGGMAREEDMQPEDEEMEEHHDSIAAAIMARKKRAEGMLLADGGMVDLDENEMEEPNQEYGLEHAALKENYDEPLRSMQQPEDSNEHGDMREDDEENKMDMISKLRSKIRSKRQF